MSTAAEPAAEGGIEDLVIRFADLEQRRSHFRPRDMLLPRFERDRFSVVGRPGEGSTAGKRAAGVDAFSVVYIRCEPGKGIAGHAHDSAEVFIVMSGTWEVEADGATTTMGPWDIISVPRDAMHGVTNVGSEPAFLMAINAGGAGVPIRLDPAVLSEIRAAGHDVPDVELPPGAAPR